MSNEEDIKEFVTEFSLMMQGFMEDHNAFDTTLIRLEEQFMAVRDDIEKLNTVVRDGNGSLPLLTRMAVLEEKLDKQELSQKRMWQLLVAVAPTLTSIFLAGLVVVGV
jgi:hypothetical protein|tara:strand:+ start:369 stop:692 length:324 start_codon:yes stop_codon:yes gene_type:complete